MKKLLIAFLVVPMLFSSCNKKLKEEMDDLEKEVQAQKEQNTNLQNQLNGVTSLIGSNEPVTATTTFKDDNDITRTVTATYSFKSNNHNTQYMEDNGDGTYGVYMERFLDVDWSEGAALFFTYNPTTGAITSPQMSHYWDWNISGYYDNAYYTEAYSPVPTITITLNSISLTTGYIDVTAIATAVDGYSGYVPNPGKGSSTTFAFKGTLAVMNDTF